MQSSDYKLLKTTIHFNSVYVKGQLVTYNYNNYIKVIWEHEFFFVI